MIERLHRVVLFCKDTNVSKAWYEQIGFEYKHGHGGMAHAAHLWKKRGKVPYPGDRYKCVASGGLTP